MVVKEYISSLEAKLRVKVILLELATEETRKSFPKHSVNHFSCKNHLSCSLWFMSFQPQLNDTNILFWRDFRGSPLGSVIRVMSVLKSLFILVHTIFIIFSREEKTWDLSSIYNILFFSSKTPKQYYKMTFNRGGWNDEYQVFIVFILIKFMLIRLFQGWLLAYICLWWQKFSILSNVFIFSYKYNPALL